MNDDELRDAVEQAKDLKRLTEALISVVDVSLLEIDLKIKALCIAIGTALKAQIDNSMIKKGREHAYVQEVLRLIREIAEGSYRQ